MNKIVLIAFFIAIHFVCSAQKRGHVVVHTSTRYISARLVAEQASKILDIKLNLRELKEHPSTGLTLPRHKCPPDVYPYYPLRSDNLDGVYISVEYSTPYKEWLDGYYLVVIASSNKNDPLLVDILANAKKFYDDAYIKTIGEALSK